MVEGGRAWDSGEGRKEIQENDGQGEEVGSSKRGRRKGTDSAREASNRDREKGGWRNGGKEPRIRGIWRDGGKGDRGKGKVRDRGLGGKRREGQEWTGKDEKRGIECWGVEGRERDERGNRRNGDEDRE